MTAIERFKMLRAAYICGLGGELGNFQVGCCLCARTFRGGKLADKLDNVMRHASKVHELELSDEQRTVLAAS